ncbi:uncharacterized protein JN550_003806 [Neoarthrinium moseri]|uniref:uncharacterized protein n=1 Tax=Neoarthrinium moseri TaxID=1658444 RepID=UPI001FDAE9F2|nr:uncharacterized protein JN550_003806 [Neoarthrinium moseri]KAI1872932.1 hypothetical protein JN550_003806 [Neoarthrinium moseri]
MILLHLYTLVSTFALLTEGFGSFENRDIASNDLPAQAQRVNQKGFNVLPTVLPPTESNATTYFLPPGVEKASWLERPFHIYDDEFLSVIGENPTLTLIANAGTNPLFHEAVVWYPPTDEVFIAQNAGSPAAGTGLNKSSIISKISLAQAGPVSNKRNATGLVDVITVNSSPMVINPKGATNYKGQILYMSEGQGSNTTAALVVMNPREPYNTTVLVNNYFGRQFNSLNDIAINTRNKDLYFTDPEYGYLQDFRPAPGLPNQVYRYNDSTGALTVAADGFNLPNGIVFSPDSTHVYVTDTGANGGFWGWNFTGPASMWVDLLQRKATCSPQFRYRFDVQQDGTLENRKTFAYINSGVPDGIHCDSKGIVYAGTGDGIQVWNQSGKLIGKIYLGETSANFRFAGHGRMVIAAEQDLYYVTLAASGADYIEHLS